MKITEFFEAVAKRDFLFLNSRNPELCAHILDVSKWQGNIDPSVYSKSDGKYMIMKASQGDWEDNKYQQNLQMCFDNEFPFGVYHFMDVRTSADDAAKFFATQVNSLPGLIIDNNFKKQTGFGKITFWLDIETNYQIYDKFQMRDYIREFLRVFNSWTDLKCGIYTTANFFDNYVALMDEVHELPLWVAHWNTWISEPYIPNDWERFGKDYVLWQYSADGNGQGSNYGAESHSIDLNRFNGDCEAFYRYFIGDADPEPPPPPVENDCLTLEVINTNALRVRDEPSTSTGIILYNLERGHVVDILDIVCRNNETWIKHGDNEYSAMWYLGSQYLKKFEGD